MKLSIIVPVYNVEKYLDKCLNSLVNQTLKDIEVIVVNDGTKDNSQLIIDKYVKEYPSIVRSFIKENGGLGSARNFGIEKSSGKYIAFVDSDDYVDINMYKSMYDKAIEDKSDIVICGNYVVNEKYNVLKEEKIINNKECENNFNIMFSNNVCVWNKIYSSKLIKNNKILFRTNVWYEDIDYTSKICALANKISIINECYYYYLIRNGSIMNNSKLNKNLDILLSFDEIIKYFKDNKIFNKYKSEIEYLAIYHIYITAITRVVNLKCNNKDKIEVINKMKEYVNNNFKDYKSNKYLNLLDNKKKLIYFLINNRCYNIIKLMFNIKRSINI